MKLTIEVVYALADTQTVVEVNLEQGATLGDALAASGLRHLLSAGPDYAARLGIWGAPASPDTILRDRDRVEIYRELTADPKQARRQRANAHRTTRTRG